MLNPVTPEFLDRIAADLGQGAIRPTSEAYLTEPRGRWTGQGHVVAPDSTADVARLLSLCNEARVPVVPYSGGTGLVGGQIASEGPVPVILSLERMTRVRAVYPSENVIEVDAGVILATVQVAARDADRLFPLSLASEGSARIGGLLSTNAGGVNVLRYGNARALCLGVEVVTANGEVLNGLSRLRKDNTGYDLRDLMIGAEGTLGVITGASLRLLPRPAGVAVALFAVPSPEAAVSLLSLAAAQLGDGISAFELINRRGPEFLAEVGPEVRIPLDPVPDWMVLCELGLPAGLDPQEALETLFVAAHEAGLVHDGAIAQSEAQRADFWTLRESIPAANRRIGSISSQDISIPISLVPDFIRQADAMLAEMGDYRINCFGHLGDGNLHYNVFPAKGRTRSDYPDDAKRVKVALHDLVHEFGGSVSAEHGIGRLKVDDLERYGDPVKLKLMRAIKDALDPNGIMNPGAVLRVKG